MMADFLLGIAVGLFLAGGAVMFLWWAFETRRKGENDDED